MASPSTAPVRNLDGSTQHAHPYASTLSGDGSIDGLLGGTKWSTNDVSFSFPNKSSLYGSDYASPFDHTNGFATFSPTMQDKTRIIVSQYADVSNLTFEEKVPYSGESLVRMSVAELSYTDEEGAAQSFNGLTWRPWDSAIAGDLWIDAGLRDGNYKLGSQERKVLIHEIGHALGLKHPHEGTENNTILSPILHDSQEFSVMSYYAHAGDDGYNENGIGSFPQTLMRDDIAAIQHLYGADFGTRAGNTIYKFNSLNGTMFVDGAAQERPAENKIFLTIWDGGGTDTYDFSNYTTGLTVSLRPDGGSILSRAQLADLGDGHVASANVYNARLYQDDSRSLIENATGGSNHDWMQGNRAGNLIRGNGGNDQLFGEDGHDFLYGDAGADTLNGGIGQDWLFGGADADRLFGQDSNDRLSGDGGQDILNGGDGADRINGGLENDTLVGDAGDDALAGDAAQDSLNGGAGRDQLRGGAGNDRIVGGSDSDVFHFARGDGIDTIEDFTAGGAQDRLVITGSSRDTFSELMAATTQGAGYCTIALEDGSAIRLTGVAKNQLTAADFSLDRVYHDDMVFA